MCKLIDFLAGLLGLNRAQFIVGVFLLLVFCFYLPNFMIALFTVVIAAAMVVGLHEVFPRSPEVEKSEPKLSHEMVFKCTETDRAEDTIRLNLGFKNLSHRITIRPKVQVRIPIELLPLNYLRADESNGNYEKEDVISDDYEQWHVPVDPFSKVPMRGLRSSVAQYAHYSFAEFPDAGYFDMFFEPPFVASDQEFRFWLRIIKGKKGQEKEISMIVSVPYFQREVSKTFTYKIFG
jgi:hypothetical protein